MIGLFRWGGGRTAASAGTSGDERAQARSESARRWRRASSRMSDVRERLRRQHPRGRSQRSITMGQAAGRFLTGIVRGKKESLGSVQSLGSVSGAVGRTFPSLSMGQAAGWFLTRIVSGE